MPPISRTESGAASPSNLDAYEALDIIGSGTFGVIRKVKRLTDGKIFARKELHFERMSDRDRKMIVSEVNILRTLTHQNIVRYEERFVDRENGIIYIIMEYCQGGDLGSTIKECRKTKRLLPEEVVLSYLSQMIQGLDACHNAPTSPSRVILHRDLKPENIFLDGEQTVKIGDFGLSKEVAAHSFACTYVGTPYYMSPELAVGAHYDVKSDIWALGCVAYELCGLRPPFDATTQAELTRKIQLGHVPELPRGYSRTLGDMIRSMLCLDPSKRPTTRTLMQHPLIRLASRRREEQHSTTLGHHRITLSKREAALDERETQLNQRQAEMEAKESSLREKQGQLTKLEEEMALLNIQMQAREQTIQRREQELTAAEAKLHAQIAESSASASTQTINQTTQRSERSTRREASNTENNNVAAAGLRRLAARRASANRMHSSPCVIMGANPFDNSDISMRDASVWIAVGGSSSSDDIVNKENRASTPLRSRRSSPAKVVSASVLRPIASTPFTKNTSSNGPPTVASLLAQDEESLPSPFLRKILRTRSHPPSSPASAAIANSEQNDVQRVLSSAPATITNFSGINNDPFASSGDQIGSRSTTTTTTKPEQISNSHFMARAAAAGAAREAIKQAAAAQQHPASSSTTSKEDDFSSSAARARRLSGMPRRRQSVLPGSVGIAPLGRKSGEMAIPSRG
ncbi:hypothetical protein L7F22_019820 [Adiantum nelumboides]|nr:hypothetical protein [Adiantum nelumboides]